MRDYEDWNEEAEVVIYRAGDGMIEFVARAKVKDFTPEQLELCSKCDWFSLAEHEEGDILAICY